MRTGTWWAAGGVLLMSALALGVSLGSIARSNISVPLLPAPPEKDLPRFSSGLQGKDFFEAAWPTTPPDSVNTKSAVVPHHLLAIRALDHFFASIADTKPTQVILLSPNHFSVGAAAWQTVEGEWQTPYGDLRSNGAMVQNLLNEFSWVRAEEKTFEGEHGVAVLTPFLKKLWPDTDFLPIVVHDIATDEQIAEVGAWLGHEYPNALVLASVDMSHVSPEYVAAYHDAVTSEYLAHGCAPADFDPAVDAPWVLQTLCAINRTRGQEAWTEVYRGSSSTLGVAEKPEDITSHIIGHFSHGLPDATPYAAVHMVGDIMLDRGTRRAIDEAGDPKYPWLQLDWFLPGSHLRVGNLEGTVNERPSKYTDNPPFEFVFSPVFVEAMKPYIDVVSLANNHTWDVGSAGEQETMRRLTDMGIPYFGSYKSPLPRYDQDLGGIPLTFISYHQFQPNLAELRAVISQAKEEGRVVVVMPHWGTEYRSAPGSDQRALAKEMIAAGANLIIGGHPHVPQGIEVIDGVPVVYSLGNFVFDQRLPETWQGLTVGIELEGDTKTCQLHLLPVATKGSQPAAMTDASARELLNRLANVSDKDIAESVRAGLLTIPNCL